VVRPGLQYGGDFVIYRGHPSETHSVGIVCIVEDPVRSLDAVLVGRAANTVNKRLIYAVVEDAPANKLRYFSFDWIGSMS